jgi:hypothetical protein
MQTARDMTLLLRFYFVQKKMSMLYTVYRYSRYIIT